MSVLDTILEAKRLEVARLPRHAVNAGDLGAAMQARDERRDFATALRQRSLVPWR